MSRASRRELGWPAAATIIVAMIGAVATSVALAIAPSDSEEFVPASRFASAREIGEVKARLESLEVAGRQMRQELRDDIKDLRQLIQRSLQEDR